MLTVDSAEEDRSLKGWRAPLTVRYNSYPDITTYFRLTSFVGADFWLNVLQWSWRFLSLASSSGCSHCEMYIDLVDGSSFRYLAARSKMSRSALDTSSTLRRRCFFSLTTRLSRVVLTIQTLHSINSQNSRTSLVSQVVVRVELIIKQWTILLSFHTLYFVT